MRNYLFFDRYLDELQQDIYEQPEDVGHTEMATEIIDKWMPLLPDVQTVLDAGCGTGFCKFVFNKYNLGYVGIDTNDIAPWGFMKGDFTFSNIHDEMFDLIFSRHTLEHSPFPLITLMEWHRIARKYLMLIVPNPSHYTYSGRNHYSVLNVQQCKWLLRRAGWEIFERDYSNATEMRFLCRKQPRLGYEGYINELTGEIQTRERIK